MRRTRTFFLLILVLGCQGNDHSSVATPTKTPKKAAADPWILSCSDPTAPEPALLWNGLVGIRIGRDGTSTGTDGKPLPSFDISKFDSDGERIRILPSPLPARLFGPDFVEDLAHAQNYRQWLDMRDAVLHTQWTQIGHEGPKQIEVETVLHPNERQIGFRATLKALTSGDLIEQKMEGAAGLKADFESVRQASKQTWDQRWRTDIQIDGPVEDQQAIRSWLFYLRSSMNPKAGIAHVISPFGLSRSTYNGHIFWDADLWVFPALALIDPGIAKLIPEYRVSKAGQASKNYQDWIRLHRPTGKKEMGDFNSTVEGIKYPWESSSSGGETVPGPSRYEDHITGSVCFGLTQAAALGLVPFDSVDQIRERAASFYLARSIPGPQGREIQGTMSPDENFIGNNDLFTNLLASWLPAGKWPRQPGYKLPHDERSFLTYDGDSVRSYKQAAAVLAIYPLQFPPAEKEAKQMMERFADTPIKNGPAMTDAIHTIVFARLGDSRRAYASFQKSWNGFMQGPLGLFTEKRNRPDAYFTTGAAGCLQSVMYGFLGFRLDSMNDQGAAWSVPLKKDPMSGDRYLSLNPHLPPQWKSVRFKNFQVLGKRYTLTATQTSTGTRSVVTQGD